MQVCYVVSFFHPFASGASDRLLCKGRSWSSAVMSFMSSPAPYRDIPIDDEEYQGIFIHRWIKTATRGPLFGLSFVTGVIAAL